MFTLYKLSLPPRRALKSFNAWLAVDYPLHILRSLLWDSVHTAVCEKSLVRIEESYYRWFVYRADPPYTQNTQAV